MIKNIYDKINCHYYHEYYCDNCFLQIIYGEIFRNDIEIKFNKFDLCSKFYEKTKEVFNDTKR